jgi:hypothetical protein
MFPSRTKHPSAAVEREVVGCLESTRKNFDPDPSPKQCFLAPHLAFAVPLTGEVHWKDVDSVYLLHLLAYWMREEEELFYLKGEVAELLCLKGVVEASVVAVL